MKLFLPFALLALSLLLMAAELTETNQPQSVQRERLFQRYLNGYSNELQQFGFLTNAGVSGTNLELSARWMFNSVVVHPSFGLAWDEVPAPTLVGGNAMNATAEFIATNGWNMQTGALFLNIGLTETRPIRGLPWEAIRDRKFKAVTKGGILYVVLGGWGHDDCGGVAYNPKTNCFPSEILGFKPIGGHWYAWREPYDRLTLEQLYEGQSNSEPGAAPKAAPPHR